MGFTKTVHPPAGATALLAATSPEIVALGWFLVPLSVLGSALLGVVGLLVNNLQRRWPEYWWTPDDVSRKGDQRDTGNDIERQHGNRGRDGNGRDSQSDSEKRKSRIVIDDERIVMPDWIALDFEEEAMLEVLRSKLQEGLKNARSKDSEETRFGYS